MKQGNLPKIIGASLVIVSPLAAILRTDNQGAEDTGCGEVL